MKKLISMLLALTVVLTVSAGCAPANEPAVENLPGTMEEVIASVNEKHSAIELPLMTQTLELSDVDGLKYNTGLTSADKITQVAVSEPMMGQPYSLVMVRVKDAADAAAVAQEMYDKIDMRKWICMEADTKVAASYGDVAMFFMVSSDFAQQVTTASMVDAFKGVCGGTPQVIGQ